MGRLEALAASEQEEEDFGLCPLDVATALQALGRLGKPYSTRGTNDRLAYRPKPNASTHARWPLTPSLPLHRQPPQTAGHMPRALAAATAAGGGDTPGALRSLASALLARTGARRASLSGRDLSGALHAAGKLAGVRVPGAGDEGLVGVACLSS